MSLIVPAPVPAALFTTVPPARPTDRWTRQIERAVVGHAAQRPAELEKPRPEGVTVPPWTVPPSSTG